MTNADTIWQDLASEILTDGSVDKHPTRPRRSIPGALQVFTRAPLVSVRHTAWRNALREMEWLCGANGELWCLHARTQHWWSRWAKNGVVPGLTALPVTDFAASIIKTPTSRRNILTTWNGTRSPVPRNDFVIQSAVTNGHLELMVFQRSANLMTGMHHNWMQYWALGLWLGNVTKVPFTTLRWIPGDVHLYDAHADVAQKCLEALPITTPDLRHTASSGQFRAIDFALTGEYCPIVCDTVEYL